MKIFWCLIVAATLFKDFAQGSCLSYGHSCWGAHGKRSDPSISANNGHNRLISLQGTAAYANGSPSNRWALVKVVPDKRSRNVIYAAAAAEDAIPLEAADTGSSGGLPTEYVRRGRLMTDVIDGEGGTNLKLRMFRKVNGNGVERQGNDQMIRRNLIADDQMLINDSEDASELASEEDAVAAGPSYINVMKQI